METEKAVLKRVDQVIIRAIAQCMRNHRETRTELDKVIDEFYEKITDDAPTTTPITNHLRGLEGWGLVEMTRVNRHVLYRLTSKGKKVLKQMEHIPPERIPLEFVVEMEVTRQRAHWKIDSLHKLKSVTKFKFSDFPEPFVNPKSQETDVLIVSAHSRWEEEKCGIPLPELRKLGIRPGNPSDYVFIPLLSHKLGLVAASKGASPKASTDGGKHFIEMRIDLHVDMDLIANHNVITIGAGNTNSVTRKVFNDFWGVLPIHFETSSGHGCINSELTGRSWNDQQHPYHGLLLMLPNMYTSDVDKKGRPNKVIIICAGVEIQGSQAGVLSLCNACDANGRPLKNNKYNPGFSAKVVKGLIQRRWTECPFGIRSNVWNVTGFEFVE